MYDENICDAIFLLLPHTIVQKVIAYTIVALWIRECSNALYVGLAHVLLPLNTKFSWLFLLTGCLKALLRDIPISNGRFQGQGYLLSDRHHVKSRKNRDREKMAFSYDLFIIIIITFFLQTIFFFSWFF